MYTYYIYTLYIYRRYKHMYIHLVIQVCNLYTHHVLRGAQESTVVPRWWEAHGEGQSPVVLEIQAYSLQLQIHIKVKTFSKSRTT